MALAASVLIQTLKKAFGCVNTPKCAAHVL